MYESHEYLSHEYLSHEYFTPPFFTLQVFGQRIYMNRTEVHGPRSWTHSVEDFIRSMPGLPMSQYSSGIQPDNAQVSSSFSPGSPPSFSPIARRRPIAVSSCFLESFEIPSLVQLQNVTTTSTSDALNRHSELSLRSSSPPRSLIRLSKTGRATLPRSPPLPSGSRRLFTGTQGDF